MDRPISEKQQKSNALKRSVPYILGILVLFAAFWGTRKLLRKNASADDLFIVPVEKGLIRSTLSASGTIIPMSERVINAPVTSEIKRVLKATGDAVASGDLILGLDQTYTALEYERLKDELSLRKNNISKLNLEYDKNLRYLDYQDQIKALQVDELQALLQDQKRLRDIGGATQEEVESADLQLKIARLEKNQLENELDYRRSVNKTDKTTLQLEYNIQAKRLQELKNRLALTSVHAPDSGVITWINEDIGRTVNEGEPLVRIANLNRFKVEALTSDRNSKDLQIGLPVEIRLDKDRLKGEISRILPEIENNTVRFYITLHQNNHPILRPNLRAEVYVIKDEKEDVLRLKRGNILKGTQSQYVYRVEQNEAIKTRITKGLVSNDYFEIVEGLQEGDRVIISDTEDFEHMDRFTINN